MECNADSLNVKGKRAKILDSILDLKNIYQSKYMDISDTLEIEEEDEESNPTEVSESDSKKKSTRKVPNQPAKKFEIGYQLLSENDNNIYQVYFLQVMLLDH